MFLLAGEGLATSAPMDSSMKVVVSGSRRGHHVAEGSTQQNDQHETQVGKLFGSKFIDPLSMLGS